MVQRGAWASSCIFNGLVHPLASGHWWTRDPRSPCRARLAATRRWCVLVGHTALASCAGFLDWYPEHGADPMKRHLPRHVDQLHILQKCDTVRIA
jgi:hypothetical protein